jgi:hypothetical protein
MANGGELDQQLEGILSGYSRGFTAKVFQEEEDPVVDVLMAVFDLTPLIKAGNRQYWGRELGYCWQLLVNAVCRIRCAANYRPAPRDGADQPFDLLVGTDAIDTKYRIGSGDWGTLKKFQSNGTKLREAGLTPIMLILREDNLKAAIDACYAGTWEVLTGDRSFEYLENVTEGFALKPWLEARKGRFPIVR